MRGSVILASLLAVVHVAPLLGQLPRDSAVISVMGHGPRTYVLISGIVGGVAGYRRLQMPLLQSGARVIVVDPYRLSIDSADVTFAALARRVDALLEPHGVDSASVVGHAHGGGVALRLASHNPKRVGALYLLDVGALGVSRTKVMSHSLRLAPFIAMFPGGKRFIRSQFIKGLQQNTGRRDWLDSVTRRLYSEPLLEHLGQAVAMAGRLARAQEPESLSSVIARVKVPVALILGDAPHPSAPEPAEFTALEPLGSLLRVRHLKGVGHFPHEEAPEETARHLLADIVTGMREGRGSRLTAAAERRCGRRYCWGIRAFAQSSLDQAPPPSSRNQR